MLENKCNEKKQDKGDKVYLFVQKLAVLNMAVVGDFIDVTFEQDFSK